MLPRSAGVVVIGGGVMGASALYHLAALGCPALLVERETLGSGSTGFCAGGVRTLFSDELNARVGEEAIRRLQRFEEEVGAALDLKLWGYLWLLGEEDAGAFRGGERVDAHAFVPQLDLDGVAAAVFDAAAGYVTPELVVQGYAARAAELGATIVQSCAATRILLDRDRVAGVETERGTVATERVILTAGVWAPELAATAGLALPVEGERRWMWVTEAAPGFPEELPLTIDFATGFYFHREGAGLAFGGREQTLGELAPHAARRLPALADLEVRSSWSGWYELSPDRNAIVGERGGIAYATGFSGHGFQQGPVVGEHLARLALGLDTPFDLSALSAERFARGELREERNVV